MRFATSMDELSPGELQEAALEAFDEAVTDLEELQKRRPKDHVELFQISTVMFQSLHRLTNTLLAIKQTGKVNDWIEDHLAETLIKYNSVITKVQVSMRREIRVQ